MDARTWQHIPSPPLRVPLHPPAHARHTRDAMRSLACAPPCSYYIMPIPASTYWNCCLCALGHLAASSSPGNDAPSRILCQQATHIKRWEDGKSRQRQRAQCLSPHADSSLSPHRVGSAGTRTWRLARRLTTTSLPPAQHACTHARHSAHYLPRYTLPPYPRATLCTQHAHNAASVLIHAISAVMARQHP